MMTEHPWDTRGREWLRRKLVFSRKKELESWLVLRTRKTVRQSPAFLA